MGAYRAVRHPVYGGYFLTYVGYVLTYPTLTGTLLGLSAFCGPVLGVVLLVVGVTFFGAASSNIWAITQTLAGPRAAGRWSGFQNFFGNLAGVVVPALTGYVLDRTGHFYWAFATLTGVALIGTISWIFLVGPIGEVDWGQPLATPSIPAEPRRLPI